MIVLFLKTLETNGDFLNTCYLLVIKWWECESKQNQGIKQATLNELTF